MARYGLTKLETQRVQGVKTYEFLNQREGDPQDVVLSKTVLGFSDFIRENPQDLVVVHGDRIEALACALVAATNYVMSAHIEGGEVSGTIDEVFRHCNTKLLTHHFVSSDVAAKRVRALGENENAIHVIGSPELDFHGGPSGVHIDEVRARYDIADREYGICTFHPVTSEADTMGAQAAALFAALEASGRYFVTIAPNNDPGSEGIFDVMDRLPKDQFRILPSMRFAHFSELMKNASCIVGNSSAGVREAPFLGVASLDIGTRQTNRSAAQSITSAKASDRNIIDSFLKDNWGTPYPSDRGFGVGDAAASFAAALAKPSFWSLNLQKSFRDDA